MFSIVYAAIVRQDGPNTLANSGNISGLEAVFENVVGIFIPLGAIVLFVVLLFGGIQYITAGANPQKVQQARNILTYGIVGMIVLSMAFLILVLIQLITGANVTEFRLSF